MNIPHYYRKFIEKSRSFFKKLLRFKRIDLFLVIAAIAVLVIITVNHTRKAPEQPKRTDINISSRCSQLFGSDAMNALIQEFEEQNPDLRIQLADAGQEADIVFFDDAEFGGLIHESALASLAPYIYTETQAGQWAAHEWALPLVSFMDVFVYNIDILKAAHCDRPPKTRAEFLTAARAVAAQESVPAFALGLSPSDPMALRRNFYPWLWANGGDISSITGSDKVFLDTVAFVKQLNSEALLAPGTFEKTSAQRLQEFAEGKIAMMLASARDIAFLEHNANSITFGITSIPVTVLGKNRLGLWNIYAGMSGGCALPDEAWIFLAFIAGKNQLLAESLGAVPGSYPGTFPGDYIAQDPFYAKAWDIFEAADIVYYHSGFENEVEINELIRVKLAEALK